MGTCLPVDAIYVERLALAEKWSLFNIHAHQMHFSGEKFIHKWIFVTASLFHYMGILM